jgi:hypothetical protein
LCEMGNVAKLRQIRVAYRHKCVHFPRQP